MTPYFHEVTGAELERLQSITIAELMEQYQQPPWCAYPEALSGVMGCWSLLRSMVKDEEFCRNCDLHKEHPA